MTLEEKKAKAFDLICERDQILRSAKARVDSLEKELNALLSDIKADRNGCLSVKDEGFQ